MKINYVPGLSYRFYPGLLRNFANSGDSFVTTSSYKMAIFTGDTPTNEEIKNLKNYNKYLSNNSSNLVFTENGTFNVTFDKNTLTRTFQRTPIDTKEYTILCDSVVQSSNVEIKSKASLYAVIYLPDKDATKNTVDNDLILVLTDVDNNPLSFVSVNKTTFLKDEKIVLRNISITLFHGYTNTDGNLITQIEDPLNPGTFIDTNVGTKTNIYLNKVWLYKLLESYKDCIIPKYDSGDLQIWHSSSSTPNKNLVFCSNRDKNGLDIGLYQSSAAAGNFVWKHGYLVNQAFIDLIEILNTKATLGLIPTMDKLCKTTNVNGNYLGEFITYFNTNVNYIVPYNNYSMALIYSMLLNPITNYNIGWWLKAELNINATLVDRALASIIPLTGMSKTNYVDTFDEAEQVLTISYTTPIKLGTKYKQSVHNAQNEKLYIFIPRLHKMDNAFQNAYHNGNVLNGPNVYATIDYIANTSEYRNESLCVDLANAKKIYDDNDSNLENRFSIIDYTAISIGLTDNGQTDLEYDIMDNLDYLDSFTVMMKIPNKY